MPIGVVEELDTYLTDAFDGMTLQPGSERGRPHLRFELGGEIPNSMATQRVSQSSQRATEVFEAAFSPDDDGFVSFARWRPEDDDVFASLLPAPVLAGLEYRDGVDFYGDGDADAPPYRTSVALLAPRELDYRRAFRLIARAELDASGRWLDGRLYLINRSRGLVWHMYDDRGALLIGRDDTDFDSLRRRFAEWIID